MDKYYLVGILEGCRDKVSLVHVGFNANAEIEGNALNGAEMMLFEVVADLGTVIESLKQV